jgi:O-antigen ligase
MPGEMNLASVGEQNLRASVPLHWIDKVAAGAVLVLLVYLFLARAENLVYLYLLFGALISVAVLLIRWPSSALLQLLIAGAIPRWFTKIHELNVKPEHLVALGCCSVLLVLICTGSHKWERFEKLDGLLLVFLAANYLSSSLYSPDVSSTLRWALLQTVAASPYFLLRQFVRTREQLDKVMNWYLWIGALEALFGIVCYYSFVTFGTVVGITFFTYLDYMPGVHGSQWEPNIFGSYCTCIAMMFLYYFLSQARRDRANWYLAGLVVTTTGISYSLARQAWVSFVFVGGMMLFFHLRRKKVRRKRLVFVVVGLLGALIAAILSMNAEKAERIASLSPNQLGEDPTVVYRASLVARALDDIWLHPIVGMGSSSFQLLYLGEDDSYQGVTDAWLGTLGFRILHDTGIIGSVLLGWFVLNLALRTWRVLRQRRAKDPALGALAAAAVVMLIAYQLTDASTLAFTWVHLGLMVTALRLAEATPEDQAGMASPTAF